MNLEPGQEFGHYRLAEKIGEGGMGEVYRGTDTALDRQVAIKVLPGEFTEDPERLARFEREAKLLAQLHHPNIASIFGVAESDGRKALVMELVEGPTLAERLESGPLPLEETLLLARQIAEALEEAHEKGIIHRDLKPQNIKASLEGTVKVLDFGLAKAMDPTDATGVSASELTRSPTLTVGATLQGTILGTAAYMAPEQAKGAAVDKRADIWAFGVVLFEMLSGRRLFAAPTVQETLAAVLTRTPDLEELPPSTPPAIRRLLRRCLERRPKSRLRDIGDARIVLDEVLTSEGGEPGESGSVEPPAPSRLPWAVAALCAAVAIGSLGVFFVHPMRRQPETTNGLTRTSILMPSRDALQQPGTFAISPDGGAVVFRAPDDSGTNRLFVRELAEVGARPLEGTDGARFPFWSPDSLDIAFFAGGELRRVPRSGGAVRRICAANDGRGGAWGSGGTIVFAPEPYGPLSRVEASGGEPVPATVVEGEQTAEGTHRFPMFLPDGRHFLFFGEESSVRGRSWIRLGSLDEVTGGRRLFDATSAPRFAPPNDVVFEREEALVAQAIDLESFEMTGQPRLLAERPNLYQSSQGAPVVYLSNAGQIVYAPPDSRPTRFVWLDRRGVQSGSEALRQGTFQDVAVSHRGDRVAAISRAAAADTTLWLIDGEGREASRLTAPGLDPWGLVWSADDQRIATWITDPASEGYGSLSLVSTGNGEIHRLLPPSGRWMMPTDVSADGRILLYWELVSGGGGQDIGWLQLEGDPMPRPYLATSANELGGRLAPGGRWIAYRSDASGRGEIYLDTFPESTRSQRVPIDGEAQQVEFRADGRELFVVASKGDSWTLFTCDLQLGERAEVGAARKLFALPSDWSALAPAPAGDRFLLLEPAGELWPSLVLVDGWRAQLAPGS